MQAPSCERHKTAQQTLFLLFADNNWFPTSDKKLLALFESRRFFWTQGGGAALASGVLYFKKVGRFLKLHHRSLQWSKSNYSDAPNVGEVPLPKLQTSRGFVALFEKIYDGEPIITVVSNIGEDVHRCFN
jgi:hypothetical protein